MEVVGASLGKLIAEATPLIPVQVLVRLVKDHFSILESQFLQAPEFVFAFLSLFATRSRQNVLHMCFRAIACLSPSITHWSICVRP